MLFNRKIQDFDFMLFFLVVGLSIFGIIAIGSATHINWADEMMEIREFKSQIVFLIVGIIIMICASVIDYNFLQKFYLLAYAANILLLVAVLVFGEERNGAKRWIMIFNIQIQPSEFSKIIMIFCIAAIIAQFEDRLNEFKILLLIGAFAVFPVLLIFIQPSASASFVFAVIFLMQLFVGGLSAKYIYTVSAIVVPSIVLVYLDIKREAQSILLGILGSIAGGKFDYQVTRIISSFNTTDNIQGVNYQIYRSMRAIGSGQFSGRGLYGGTLNQLSYLPEQHNDFIFSVIGEEFGFVGSVAVIGTMFLIIFRCIVIAYKSHDIFGKLICTGVASMFAFQAFVNVAVATAIIPTTGMSFPFVSYGGSSLWTNMIAVGFVLNVGVKTEKSLFKGD